LEIPSFGKPIEGSEMRENLKYLIENGYEIARPEQGKFV
jgi:hypothetical protein